MKNCLLPITALGCCVVSALGAEAPGGGIPEVKMFGDVQPVTAVPPGGKTTLGQALARVLGGVKAAPVHRLTFQDGSQLRGELLSLEKNEIVWKRPDSQEPLRFNRAEVRQIAFQETAPTVTLSYRSAPPKLDPSIPAPATVKLPGGDWLRADVSSTNGQDFALSLGSDTKFTVSRKMVEWIYFGPDPLVGADLSPGPMALDGWAAQAPGAALEEKDGWMNVKGTGWIGCAVFPPSRFEISVDLEAKDEAISTIWIQPFGPRVNAFGSGTVSLALSPGKVRRSFYANGMAQEEADAPKEGDAAGRASYRIFYDSSVPRLVVVRNGKQIGDWKLTAPAGGGAALGLGEVDTTERLVSGVCLQRSDGPRFGRFSVRPWDGVVPPEGEAARTQDRLSIGKDAPIAGKLESLNAQELVFSGQTKPRGAGTYLQLSDRLPAAAGSDARLNFGNRGDLAAADLEIHDGRMSFRTGFAEKVELPLAALNTLFFTAAPPKPFSASVLIFHNGDELPGTLLRAESGGALKWQTPSGQQLEFQPDRVAGVQFPAPAEPASLPAGMLEFRNGDALRGEITGFDEKAVQFKHPLFGALPITVNQVWALRPNTKNEIRDAARDPASWTNPATPPQPGTSKPRILYLDGQFVIRMPVAVSGYSTGESPPSLTQDLKGLPEKMELRLDLNNLSGRDPTVTTRFTSEPGESRSTLDVSCSNGSLRYYGYLSGKKSRSFSKSIPLRANNGVVQPEPRLSLRVFIDNRLGTVDVFVNGVHRIKSSTTASERLPGIAGRVIITPYSNNTTFPVIVSGLWVGPWNGELPALEPGPATSLVNGDVAEGRALRLQDGKVLVDLDGEVQVPVTRVREIGFGGIPGPGATPPAGRVRLVGGETLSVDSFRFESGEVVTRHASLGELRIPAARLRELIFQPAPVRFPQVVDPKTVAPQPAEAQPMPAIQIMPRR